MPLDPIRIYRAYLSLISRSVEGSGTELLERRVKGLRTKCFYS